MISRKTLQSGMTLVELLIVITIIGVLSTIILSSVSTSRARAYDSKIKQQLSSFRAAAEIYFNNQIPNNYGPAVSICNAGMFADNTEANGRPAVYIDPINLPTYSIVACSTNGTSYAVKASLYSGTDYWCVDNQGRSKMYSGSVTASVSCE